MAQPMSLADRLAVIEGRIAAACAAAGRGRAEVTLVGVTKEQPEALVREGLALGLVDLGENRVQALGARQEAFPEARWHLIGPVQSNKAKIIARRPPALLHTVDRAALVEVLDKELAKAGTRLEVLIQVDVDDEPQKAGVGVDELDALVERVVATERLVLRGLMAIPRPLEEVGELVLGRTFETMARLTEKVAPAVTTGRPILSMGMSDDFELAIAFAATHVRIGSALFGPRPGQAGG